MQFKSKLLLIFSLSTMSVLSFAVPLLQSCQAIKKEENNDTKNKVPATGVGDWYANMWACDNNGEEDIIQLNSPDYLYPESYWMRSEEKDSGTGSYRGKLLSLESIHDLTELKYLINSSKAFYPYLMHTAFTCSKQQIDGEDDYVYMRDYIAKNNNDEETWKQAIDYSKYFVDDVKAEEAEDRELFDGIIKFTIKKYDDEPTDNPRFLLYYKYDVKLDIHKKIADLIKKGVKTSIDNNNGDFLSEEFNDFIFTKETNKPLSKNISFIKGGDDNDPYASLSNGQLIFKLNDELDFWLGNRKDEDIITSASVKNAILSKVYTKLKTLIDFDEDEINFNNLDLVAPNQNEITDPEYLKSAGVDKNFQDRIWRPTDDCYTVYLTGKKNSEIYSSFYNNSGYSTNNKNFIAIQFNGHRHSINDWETTYSVNNGTDTEIFYFKGPKDCIYEQKPIPIKNVFSTTKPTYGDLTTQMLEQNNDFFKEAYKNSFDIDEIDDNYYKFIKEYSVKNAWSGNTEDNIQLKKYDEANHECSIDIKDNFKNEFWATETQFFTSLKKISGFKDFTINHGGINILYSNIKRDEKLDINTKYFFPKLTFMLTDENYENFHDKFGFLSTVDGKVVDGYDNIDDKIVNAAFFPSNITPSNPNMSVKDKEDFKSSLKTFLTEETKINNLPTTNWSNNWIDQDDEFKNIFDASEEEFNNFKNHFFIGSEGIKNQNLNWDEISLTIKEEGYMEIDDEKNFPYSATLPYDGKTKHNYNIFKITFGVKNTSKQYYQLPEDNIVLYYVNLNLAANVDVTKNVKYFEMDYTPLQSEKWGEFLEYLKENNKGVNPGA